MSGSKISAGKPFVAEAYGLGDKTSMVEFYQKWADDYDHQMLDNLGYLSPRLIGGLLLDFLPTTSATIIDIGCGTGLTSLLLHEKGCASIDGLDFSADMLRVAEGRDVYRNLIEADLNRALVIADDSYDAAISSGTFTHGHVGPEPLDEIFRILKSNGLLACTIHLDLWSSRGFEQKLQHLIDTGVIRCLYKAQDRYYQNGEAEGWFCVYQKC